MSYPNTQVGQEVQLNGLGNSIAGSGQGTTVQLGALNNSNPTYRDPLNPCQSYYQTNYMGSFRNRNLVYLSGVIGGPAVSLTGQYFSVFSGASVLSTTYMQGAGYAQGYINGGYYYGTGGDGGAGGSAGQGGFPGGTGRAGFEFQGGAYGVLHVQGASVYGGGGGGGGGGSFYGHVDSEAGQTYIGLGGGGGGAGRGGGGAFGNGGPGGYGDYASGQGGGAGPGGTGGSYYYYFSAGAGGQGGYSDPGQPGASGGTYGGGGGGGQGSGVSGFPGNDYVQWENSPHN